MAQTATLTMQSPSADSGGISTTGGSTSTVLSDGNPATYVFTAGFPGSSWVECVATDMPASLAILSVTVVVSARTGGAAEPASGAGTQRVAGRLKTHGVSYTHTFVGTAGTTGSYSFPWTVNPNTGLPWTPAEVNAATYGADYDGDGIDSPEIKEVTVSVSYIPVPPFVQLARFVGGMLLWLKKRAERFLPFTGDMTLLSVGLLEHVDLEHIAGPHGTDQGWKSKVWQRRSMAQHVQTIDPNSMTVTSKLKDQRPVRILLRDLAWSTKASGTLGDGIAIFAVPGATRTFTRASEATFTNPVGETEIVPADFPCYAEGGMQILPASGGRAADFYRWSNNSSARVLRGAQGSFVAEVSMAAVSGSVSQTVAYAYHDASNWWWLYWDGANGRWVFEVRAAGTTYRAVKSASPSPDTFYQIGARWTGANGELDVDPYTLSVWVDRVKGTDAVAAAAMTEQSTAVFYIGSQATAGTTILNGLIRNVHSFQHVLEDFEMERPI